MKKKALLISLPLLFVVLLGVSLLQATYVDKPSSLIFSHELHVGQNGVTCTQCHKKVTGSANSDDHLQPEMDVCGECHDIKDDGKCKMCHRDPNAPEASPNRVRTINFQHNRHAIDDDDCPTCHAGVNKTVTLTDANYPSMQVCSGCHDDGAADAKCALCHRQPIPAAYHPQGYLKQHGVMAENDPDRCKSCHAESKKCQECHQGENMRQTPHGRNYRYTHSMDARDHEYECADCHDAKSFCSNCHRGADYMPPSHSSKSWTGSAHGQAAQGDPEYCAACHSTELLTCVRCHSDRDGIKGTNRSPHEPLDFHGPWHNDPGYLCFQCHVSTRTPGQGFCGYCHERR